MAEANTAIRCCGGADITATPFTCKAKPCYEFGKGARYSCGHHVTAALWQLGVFSGSVSVRWVR